MNLLKIHTDGGARGNPGPAAIGVVFDVGEWQLTHERVIGTATNNVAEYTAVQDALEKIKEIKDEQGPFGHLNFYLDSELVVKQIRGEYRIKEPTLQVLCQNIKQQLQALAIPYTFTHVPRAENKLADTLVNHALDTAKIS